MIRLIGIDVDGTLLDSRGHLPAANREAIAEAVEQYRRMFEQNYDQYVKTFDDVRG